MNSRLGIRSTLLRSAIVLVIFYTLLGWFIFASMPPHVLQEWAQERGVEVGRVDVLNALGVAARISLDQAQRILPAILISMVLSMVVVAGSVATIYHLRAQRNRARAPWRGVRVSRGATPIPPAARQRYGARVQVCDERGVGISGNRPLGTKVCFPGVGCLRPEHVLLARELIGFLLEHENVSAGEAHGATLMEHTSHVLQRAARIEGGDALLPLAALAHDIGKTTGKREHDKAGARLLATLTPWWALEPVERKLLLLAVKYEHTPGKVPVSVPGLDGAGMARLRRLIQQLRKADSKVTAEEKDRILDRYDLTEEILKAAMAALAQLPYHAPGSSAGHTGAGWRVGDTLYVLEHRLRDKAMNIIPDDALAMALGEKRRARGQIAPFTRKLAEILDTKGMLVTTIEREGEPPLHAAVDRPLWVIRSGKKEYEGVLALRLGEEYAHLLPEETHFSITVIRALSSRDDSMAHREVKRPPRAGSAPPEEDPPPASSVEPQDDMGGGGIEGEGVPRPPGACHTRPAEDAQEEGYQESGDDQDPGDGGRQDEAAAGRKPKRGRRKSETPGEAPRGVRLFQGGAPRPPRDTGDEGAEGGTDEGDSGE